MNSSNLKRLSNVSNKMKTSYKNYTNLIKRIDEMRMKYNENETRDQELEDKYLEESKFYHDIYEKIIWDIFTTGKIPFLRDMFENFSLPFKFIEYGKVNKSIFIGLSGELIGDGDFANYFTYDNITLDGRVFTNSVKYSQA